jgi:hypothetical protein
MFPHTGWLAYLLPRFPVVEAALSVSSLEFGRRTVAHALKACQYMVLSMEHNERLATTVPSVASSLQHRACSIAVLQHRGLGASWCRYGILS